MSKAGLSRRFWYLASVVILGAFALGADLVWNSFVQYSANEASLVNLRQFHDSLAVMTRISAERGPANAAMTELAGAQPFTASLQESRAGVDQALGSLRTQIVADEASFSARALARFDAVRDTLAAARKRVDAVIAQAPANRGTVELQDVIEGMFGVVDVTQGLVDELGGRTTEADPSMAPIVIVATLVTELRDVAGRLGSQYIVPLRTQQPPSAGRLTDITRLRARIEQMRTIVAANLRTCLDDPRVADAWADVNMRYFGEAFRLLDGIRLGQDGAVPYAMTPAEFTTALVPNMSTLQALGDAILTVTFERAISARDRTWRVMTISGLATGLIILTMISIIAGMQRFLFQPLLYIRDQIMALALGTPGEVPMPSAKGEEIREVLTALRLLRESQRARLTVERERDELNLRLKTLADTDPLTGLLNRRALDNAIKSGADQFSGFDGAMGLILLDLDHFKAVNDVHGHPAGDAVLQETARRIRQCVRKSDMAARFGGEEFAIVVAQPNIGLMETIAEKVRAAMADSPIAIDKDTAITVTASLGVALGRGGEEGWAQTLSSADQALYRAKDEGRNRVVVARRLPRSRAA
ncbi:MAG: GGDEF domain-containing protein [Xanthobacteraceae bacterium]|nr:GGDEF domain-containing protein [Xanthobacteraceae bacterium]